jgi:hypothetical protein
MQKGTTSPEKARPIGVQCTRLAEKLKRLPQLNTAADRKDRQPSLNMGGARRRHGPTHTHANGRRLRGILRLQVYHDGAHTHTYGREKLSLPEKLP